jgi:hypothetical protein
MPVSGHVDGLMTAHFAVRKEAFPALLEAYPDDPTQGSPQGTGRGLLPSGKQDKRVRLIRG